MKVHTLRSDDVYSVLMSPSKEATADMNAFGSSVPDLAERAEDAYPFAWTIWTDKPECVCWYNVRGDKAITSMFYSDTFLSNKGITELVKKIIDDNVGIAKRGGLTVVECHSTLSHPLSEGWYIRLGFTKTDRTYHLKDKLITIFERKL